MYELLSSTITHITSLVVECIHCRQTISSSMIIPFDIVLELLCWQVPERAGHSIAKSTGSLLWQQPQSPPRHQAQVGSRQFLDLSSEHSVTNIPLSLQICLSLSTEGGSCSVPCRILWVRRWRCWHMQIRQLPAVRKEPQCRQCGLCKWFFNPNVCFVITVSHVSIGLHTARVRLQQSFYSISWSAMFQHVIASGRRGDCQCLGVWVNSWSILIIYMRKSNRPQMWKSFENKLANSCGSTFTWIHS